MTTTSQRTNTQPSQWTITPVPPSSFEAWTSVQFASFNATINPMHDSLYPRPKTPADLRKTIDRHRAALAADPEHISFVQIVDEKTGDIAGGAKWFFYEKDAGRERVIVDFVDEDENREFAQRIMDEMQGRRIERMKGPHTLLELLFTNPAYERQGVGSALVKWGLCKADEKGWRSFVEGSVLGEPMYARHGFVSTEAVTLQDPRAKDDPPVVWYHMERDPVA